MLTLFEKAIFIIAAVVSIYLTFRAAIQIMRTIGRGQGKLDWRNVPQQLMAAFGKTSLLQPTFRTRLVVSLLHACVAWGFIYYLLVNLGDLLEAFLPGFVFLGSGMLGNFYRLGADILSVAAMVGMVLLLVRRFLFRSKNLTTRDEIMLHPKARLGIRRDSALVGVFILVHVGSRFMGASLTAARNGPVFWQPFANLLAKAWLGWDESWLVIGEHTAYWLAVGTILAFLPYFSYSKHLHLFFAPLNFALKPHRRSIGELSSLDFEDESIEQFGATRIEDLGWEQIMDAYACIMCNRCQDACPAYVTGKVLSPAALEINKRYALNKEGVPLTKGEPSSQTLLEFAIPPEAVWACTACGACIDICPVGNEPMRDILDIRRALVLMENAYPEQLQTAFRGMERSQNPWNIPSSERMRWADGLGVVTIEENPNPDTLWWVGCAPATDPRAQRTAAAFAKLLTAAGENYAVLGSSEQCTGDSARRAGNEFLFNELAVGNVELLNEVVPKRIVTTCPHCLHTLQNEYPAFGGNYTVIHHSQLIQEWLQTGKLAVKPGAGSPVTFHDPCYLGRQNGIVKEPRQVLQASGATLVEMPRHGRQSFCCGAGGAQMWKEEEAGTQRVSANRMQEAAATSAQTVAVGCPFCLVMLTDAANEIQSAPKVVDIAEIILDQVQAA